ncbi:MAG TPA: hypothetical protein EYN03_07265 [Planctomycetes bacterium]|nr:hypothetical protein [Planctomycetota bacterium]
MLLHWDQDPFSFHVEGFGMNRVVLFGVAIFFAFVSIALLGGDNLVVAGHGCHGFRGGKKCDGATLTKSHCAGKLRCHGSKKCTGIKKGHGRVRCHGFKRCSGSKGNGGEIAPPPPTEARGPLFRRGPLFYYRVSYR